MIRLALVLEYDGTLFHGWQLQPDLRTVQLVLEVALAAMMEAPVRVIGSGRTDAGVHALAQTAHCDVPKAIRPDHVLMGLNSMLPPDVRVVACRRAPEGFHARFSALAKTYRYRILNRRAPTALHRHRAWHVRQSLDLAAMEEGAGHLRGRRDFAAFRSAGEEGSAVRELRELTLGRKGDFLDLTFTADGFLKHMVRNMTGVLVEAGMGRFPPGRIRELLEAGTREAAPRAAPAQGLTLMKVYYPEEMGL